MRGHLAAIASIMAAVTLTVGARAQEAFTFGEQLLFDVASPSIELGELSTPPSLAWHERFSFGVAPEPGFSLSAPNSLSPDWNLLEDDGVALARGGRWSFTLDFDLENDRLLDFSTLRAGAFFDVTPRLTLRGAVALTNQDELLNGGEQGEDVPSIRLESAFRF